MERDRVERLLALLLLQSMRTSPASERMMNLNIAGFSHIEIADILQVSPAGVAQRIYEARKAKAGKSPKKPQKKKSSKG